MPKRARTVDVSAGAEIVRMVGRLVKAALVAIGIFCRTGIADVTNLIDDGTPGRIQAGAIVVAMAVLAVTPLIVSLLSVHSILPFLDPPRMAVKQHGLVIAFKSRKGFFHLIPPSYGPYIHQP